MGVVWLCQAHTQKLWMCGGLILFALKLPETISYWDSGYTLGPGGNAHLHPRSSFVALVFKRFWHFAKKSTWFWRVLNVYTKQDENKAFGSDSSWIKVLPHKDDSLFETKVLISKTDHTFFLLVHHQMQVTGSNISETNGSLIVADAHGLQINYSW